jgi:type I restriction enzyme M protein
MLTSDTKRHIDSARQVLVGKIPNPIGQVQEITKALIYKFMDDMDEQAAALGGKRRYFIGDFEKYSWRTIMSPQVGAQERIDLYQEALKKMSINPGIPVLFQQIFRNAHLPYNDGRTLTLFLTEINYFDYKHSEELGNAYEYLLSIMGSQGDAGQFRTPRHIIDFIVDAVDPGKNDKVLDPACGTAGFLISAYKHVLAKHDGKDDATGENTTNESPLTADEKNKLYSNYTGFDIDDEMAKLSQVNMFLHGFISPNILVHDSLSSEDYWHVRYDVILANPPFMSPKGGIVPHNKFGVQSNRAEVLFVDYIMSHLKPSGRAGVIVPEGIIFQSGTAYKQLRKNLIDDGLYAVVSLPSGVFNPYSGVKTSILLLNKDLAKQKDELVFIKIENDGFDLGAQRRMGSKNDLPMALDILNKWNSGEKVENSIVLYVEKSKIADSGDYNLSGDRYRADKDYTNVKWPMMKFDSLASTISPPAKISKDHYMSVGSFPIIDQSQDEIAGWTNDETTLVKSEKPLVVFGDHTCAVKYIDRSFAQGADGIKILLTNEHLIPKYLYYILKTKPVESEGYQRHFSKLKRYEIPMPPIEIQKQIVAEINGYQNIINGANQIVSSWKPNIPITSGWEKVKLETVADINSKSVKISPSTTYNYIDITSVENGSGEITLGKSIVGKELPSRAKRAVMVGDVLLSTVRPNLKAYAYITELPENPVASTGFAVISAKPNILAHWIYYSLLSDSLQNQMINQMGKGAYPSINQNDIQNLEISLPPLEIQNQIVEKIEAERIIIEAAKKLIDIYELKTKDTVAKLWE